MELPRDYKWTPQQYNDIAQGILQIFKQDPSAFKVPNELGEDKTMYCKTKMGDIYLSITKEMGYIAFPSQRGSTLWRDNIGLFDFKGKKLFDEATEILREIRLKVSGTIIADNPKEYASTLINQAFPHLAQKALEDAVWKKDD